MQIIQLITYLPKDIIKYCIHPFLSGRDIMILGMGVSYYEYNVNYFEEHHTKYLTYDNDSISDSEEYDEKFTDLIIKYDPNYELTMYNIYQYNNYI